MSDSTFITGKHGSIERPILVPHLEYRVIGKGQVLLVSETFNTLLHGDIYPDLLMQLDGHQTVDEITKNLSSAYSESLAKTALTNLAAKGYIVSAEFQSDAKKAAFWSSMGASPIQVEKRLNSATLALKGDHDNRLSGYLESLGIKIDASQPDLTVLICDDYLSENNSIINNRHLDSGTPWILIRPMGMYPLFGPVFQPAQKGPCWDCLAHRLKNNNEVHSFLRNRCGESAAFRPFIVEPLVLDIVYSMIALEIAKWLVLGESAPIHSHAITVDVASMKSASHFVMRRPQCESCGQPEYRDANRDPLPLELKPGQTIVHSSGGIRTLTPAQTLEKFRHLISPVSGIVTWVKRRTPVADEWLNVHWAGSNIAMRTKSLDTLRRSLRSKSAGKGTTSEQSEVGAFCEAVERYSGAFHGDEIRQRRRLQNFIAEGDNRAIHPNDVQLFSNLQLDHADEINARGHPYNVVPPHFDVERELDWTPVWSFTENRFRYLPTALLYIMTPEQRGDAGIWGDANGCAAGNTLEEAILQGFLELVERDAFSIWWYNQLQQPGVDLDSFGDEYLAAAADYYGRFNRDLWVLDITGDLEIPAFVALSRRTDRDCEDIIFGAGAHIDPHIAVLRAICELNQCLIMVPRHDQKPERYTVDDPTCLQFWQNEKLKDNPYLAPASEIAPRRRTDYIVPDTEDLKDCVEWCRAKVEAKKMEFIVLDQTRPDIGMPVARVLVPGLRHFWARFAPGRLYDVPVSQGLKSEATKEADLNPIPVFI